MEVMGEKGEGEDCPYKGRGYSTRGRGCMSN